MIIEDIIEGFEALPAGTPGVYQLKTLVEHQLHLSRDTAGNAALLLEGSAESFGPIMAMPGVQHIGQATAQPSGRDFQALCVTAPDSGFSQRVLAHIAYELERKLSDEPSIDNAALIHGASWILGLLGDEPSLMSRERINGLVGECILLRRLVETAVGAGLSAQVALDRWWGPSGGKKDFASKSTAIEVKTTGLNSRQHHIASLDQLESTDDEQVYLYSVGLRSEPTSARTLPVYVEEVIAQLVHGDGSPDPEARTSFEGLLLSTGYDVTKEAIYRATPGTIPNPAVPVHIYRVDDLERLSIKSFKGDELPSTVAGVSYQLSIQADPLSIPEEQAVLAALLEGAPLGA